MGMNGSDFLLMANIGTPLAPVYDVVGYQRDATIDETNATIDVSTRDDLTTRVMAGRYSAKVTLEALYVPTNVAYLALLDACRASEMILIARQLAGLVLETAQAKIDSLSESYPDQSEATVSISLTIDGAWIVNESPIFFNRFDAMQFEDGEYAEWL